MLYAYGLKIGARLLWKRDLDLALRLLGKPEGYWRTVEFPLVLAASRIVPGARVLDVGSPKLFALYLADVLRAEVYATDLNDYFIEDYERIRDLKCVPKESLHLRVEDGRKLSFADGFFDTVFSIEVLSHIPGTGDSDCMRELARVLAPMGLCVVTVAFARESRDEFRAPGTFYWAPNAASAQTPRIFYGRRYSMHDLFERLIEPSGLRLVDVLYIGERILTRSEREVEDYLPLASGPIQPLLSRMFHTIPTKDVDAFEKPLCAVVVLQKN